MYRSCRDLPLNLFIECVVAEDYTSLVISGAFPEAVLKSKWLDIYSEYCDLIENIQIVAMIRQVIELATLDNRITRIQSIVSCLQVAYLPELLNELNASGYRVKYDPDNEPAYQQGLKNVLSKLNPQILRYKMLQAEVPRGESGKKASYEDFEMILAEISEMQHYEVSDSITVYKYCTYVKKLKKRVEKLKKSPNGRK